MINVPQFIPCSSIIHAVMPPTTNTIAAGAKLGPYEVVAPIGAGGMGEVYRARDTRLERDVAVKVLPPLFAADPDGCGASSRRRARPALNHPNILAVYDVGTHDGAPYIVLGAARGRDAARAPRRLAAAAAQGVSRSRRRSPTASPRRTRRASSIAT